MRYTIIVLLCTVCLFACAGRGVQRRQNQTPPPPIAYGYKTVASYPHDTGAYTQGLFWHDGALYESTGEYGRSTMRRVDLATGETVRETALSGEYFAEGAALIDGSVYQLTWMEGKCFVYDPATLRRTGEFEYKGQGWGLATDGERLYMSDGTPNIVVRDPAGFRAGRTMVVRREGRAAPNINEMEWIDGRLWANVYGSYDVLIIDPADGRVEGVVDFSRLVSQIDITPTTDVMNGIACDPATGRIWVTGKNWNRLFEVEIFKK